METTSKIQFIPPCLQHTAQLTQSRHQKALEVLFHPFIWQDVIIRTAFTIRAHIVDNLADVYYPRVRSTLC